MRLRVADNKSAAVRPEVACNGVLLTGCSGYAGSTHADHTQTYRSVIFAVTLTFVVMFSCKLMYGIFYGIYRLLLLVIRRHDALL